MTIEWRDVRDFEGIYQISNSGDFRRNLKNPRKAQYPKQVNRLGYQYISISKNGKKFNKTVHQMVAAAFIDGFVYGMHVNHVDGNKLNNHLNNLELTNPVHNNTHAHTLPTTPKPGKSIYRNVSIKLDKRHKNPKPMYMASVKINKIRHYLGTFNDETDAAKAVDSFLDEIGDTTRLRNFP